MPIPPSGSGGFRRAFRRVAIGACLALLVSPLEATIWTRSITTASISSKARIPLRNATYMTRDWSVSVANVEMQPSAEPQAGISLTSWAFEYTNTDHAAHHVAITLQYLDAGRRNRMTFSHVFALEPTSKEPGVFVLNARCPKEAGSAVVSVRATVDFLSGPEG